MKILKKIIKRIAPKKLWRWMHNVRVGISLMPIRWASEKTEKHVRKSKSCFNVLFFVVDINTWKYDSLYKLMENNAAFRPMIIVCPIVNNGHEYMMMKLKQSSAYFTNKRYKYLCAYDDKNDCFIDPYNYRPDIIFYSSPYDELIDTRYRRDRFKRVLSCYVNYFYVTNTEKWSCAERFHISMWRYYMEYPILLKQANNLSSPCKIEGRVVGYPLFDMFRKYKISETDWPVAGSRRKKIIWAPHHTISGNTGIYAMSTFEKYFDFMWRIAEKYKNKIDIVFKPHPLLKPHLYDAEDWGRERTDAYYDKWAKGETTAFADGEYVGIFLASDAMIHDCNSFTVEYLAVNKPAMFLDSGMTDDKINEVGKEARACYYKGYCEEDIENFIKMIIEGDDDKLKEKREAFYKNFILPPNGKLAAENIIDDLLTSLGRKPE